MSRSTNRKLMRLWWRGAAENNLWLSPALTSMFWLWLEMLSEYPLVVIERSRACHMPGARGAERRSDGLSKVVVLYSHLQARDVCLTCPGHPPDGESHIEAVGSQLARVTPVRCSSPDARARGRWLHLGLAGRRGTLASQDDTVASLP